MRKVRSDKDCAKVRQHWKGVPCQRQRNILNSCHTSVLFTQSHLLPTAVIYHCQLRSAWRVFLQKRSLSVHITFTLTALLAPVLQRNRIKKILFLSVACGKTLPITQSNLASISQEHRHGVDPGVSQAFACTAHCQSPGEGTIILDFICTFHGFEGTILRVK